MKVIQIFNAQSVKVPHFKRPLTCKLARWPHFFIAFFFFFFHECSLRHACLKGHCHDIWQFYKKLKRVFASIEFQNQWSSFVIKDYLKVLKLFPVACSYGCHGWKWIEFWKKWPIFSSFDATCSKNPEEIYYS